MMIFQKLQAQFILVLPLAVGGVQRLVCVTVSAVTIAMHNGEYAQV